MLLVWKPWRWSRCPFCFYPFIYTL